MLDEIPRSSAQLLGEEMGLLPSEFADDQFIKKVVYRQNETLARINNVERKEEDVKCGRNKPKVRYHIPSIQKPQDEYNIFVNNSNQPFQHVCLHKSEDGSRFVHPLEKFSAKEFVDKNISHIKPVKPPPVECTPCKLVEDVKDLKELAAKLLCVNEFVVDLEHNQYRSFQGLTCLMQISTRFDDFVVDTLKLWIHIGPYLRDIFKDPTKKKVMHGADQDVKWLQRDFGIYICNLFDTHQASRVLQLDKNSLEFLLHHFCGVTANKEYQKADWRLRPITDEMLRYAREDTHYLLHIFDLMRMELSKYNLLLEVYQLSYDTCMQLYQKEVLTESSYLNTYGLQNANLNAHQLAVAAGLYEWRDVVARVQDESTGYILPNKTLLEIAEKMPVEENDLCRLVKSNHQQQYIERNLAYITSIISIISHCIQNASSYESTAEMLRERQMNYKSAAQLDLIAADESDPLCYPNVLARSKAANDAELTSGRYEKNVNLFKHLPVPVKSQEKILDLENSTNEVGGDQYRESSVNHGDSKNVEDDTGGYVPALSQKIFAMPKQIKVPNKKFFYPVCYEGNGRQVGKFKECGGLLPFKPFDKLGHEEIGGLQFGTRHQAFPATGNRSAKFG